jgi:regulation of enolase protein 1 (concanavalin A-like superfamily)
VHGKKSVSLFCLTSALLFANVDAARVFAADQIVPPPWHSDDIGAVGTPGYGYEGPDGDLFIAGAGSDIWGTADSFRFVYQTIRDGEISTQNGFSQDGTNPFAKTGVMIRLSLDPSSPFVILDAKPDGGIEFMTRSTQGGETTFIAGGSTTVSGRVLKLVRSGGTVTGFACNQSTCTTIGSAPFFKGPALIGVAVTSHDPSKLNHAYFAAAMPKVLTVPQPWYSLDFGDVGLAGSAFFEDGTFWVTGAGSDIWGTSDSFRFVRQCLLGSGEIVARVLSEQNTNTYAKAGIIINSLYERSTVILDVRPEGGIEFMARPPGDGSQMAFIAGGTTSLPVWLKLVRNGDQFSGFTSSDGTNWQLVGTTTISMRTDVCSDTGLAVTSHDKNQLNQSVFDNVSVTSEAFQDRDIGAVGRAGGATYNDAGVFVAGAGADIWGTSDAFNFLYRGANGDDDIVVRLDSMQDTNTFAKAGLMLRETIDPSSAHVILDVRPNGSIEFMTRSATGAPTSFIAGGTTTVPIWLKLSRSGSVVTGYTSSDGSAWAVVGSTTLSIASNALMGLAVTSHNPSVLNTAAFESIGR